MEAAQIEFGPVKVYLGEKNGKYPDGNQVVVTGSDSKAIFDTPLSANRIAERLRDADLAILGHVHEDHVCGLHLIPDAPVFAPWADVKALRSEEGLMAHYGYAAHVRDEMLSLVREKFGFRPRPDAQGYGDGAEWDLGGVRVRAIHLPGHTGGHSVLVVDPPGVAFLGDIDLSGFGPYYGDGCSSLVDFAESLERVPDIEARIWITSHHKGVVTDRDEFLALLKRFCSRIGEREQAIWQALGVRPMTLDDLVTLRFLYPQGYHEVFVEDAERYTIRRHLERLLTAGRVAKDDGTYYQLPGA